METNLEGILACPKCHSPLQVTTGDIKCKESCGFVGTISDGVIAVEPRSSRSFFDDKFETMTEGNETKATRHLFLNRQVELTEKFFAAGKIVLDVGCGPALAYSKHKDCLYIGLDYSYESIRANKQADLRIYGSAAALPIASKSVDTLLCYYSIHHMVGETLTEGRNIVDAAFKEFARVLKPGGDLLVFEVSPLWPFGHLERMVWNKARRMLKKKLDMFFWTEKSLKKLAQGHLKNFTFAKKTFNTSPFYPVYPVFALRWLKVPRFLYPFGVRAYHWHSDVNHEKRSL